MTSLVTVTRGPIIESRHRVSVAAVNAGGALVAWSGDPDVVAYWRSAAKFFQAIPCILEGAANALGISEEELALACASHNGEPRHVELAHSLLARSGASPDDLVCGPHASLNDEIARSMREKGERPTRAHSNCSGKHAAMIATARHRGWGSAGYHLPEHPLQRACLEQVSLWSGASAATIPCAADGCGVPSFALPLRAMALAYARVAAAANGDDPGVGEAAAAAARRLVGAVRAHPFNLAGTGRLDTDLVVASQGRVVAKVGAEGVYCALVPELRLGIALKVEDGATRALNPALLATLELVAPGLVGGLALYRSQPVRNTTGVAIGAIEARMELQRDA
jgi:L-asparaginase II